jgi:predicted nuclease of predicted toxin-antitoxin system
LPIRLLLDECVPRKLRSDLEGHEVRTVQEIGWAGKKNGELVTLAAESFDVLITVDRNFIHPQNLQGRQIALILIEARTNRLVHLRPLMPEVRRLLPTVQQGQVIRVGRSAA